MQHTPPMAPPHAASMLVAAVLAAGCSLAAAEPHHSEPVFAAVTALEVPSPAAEEPLRTWIGKVRSDVEAGLRAEPVEEEGGWVRYGDALRVRYDLNIVVGVAGKAPAGLDCVGAARWMGFSRVEPPVETESSCEWTRGGGHSLGHGHGGRMDKRTRMIEIRVGG